MQRSDDELPKKHIKKTPPKVYVGNAHVEKDRADITLDITEILEHEESWRREVTITGDKIFLDITLLPFRAGTNKFGKNYYAIIKNK